MPDTAKVSQESRQQLLDRIVDLEAELAQAHSGGADFFRKAVEAAPNGIVLADATGHIVLANQRAMEMFGYADTEWDKLTVENLIPERFRHGHVAQRERYQEAPDRRPMGVGRDLFALRKDGSEFPVEIGLTPVEIGGEQLTLGMLADITERKKGEEALRKNARILAGVHEAVFTVGAGGNIESWNPGAGRIFGWEAEEIVGRPVSALWPDDEARRYADRIRPALLRNGHYESILRCCHRSGGNVTVAIRASLLDPGESGGERSGRRAIICANDISRQKQLEDEIVQISEKEQRRIGQDLHDDLCQQLASIACLTQVLQQQIAAAGDTESAESLGQIGEMISQVNVRAREICRGLAPAIVRIEGLTSALAELAAHTRKVFGVPCRFHCPDPVFLDDEKAAVQLYRIAQEAIANAVKHSDAGKIEVSLNLLPGNLRLRISDDGRGLPPKAAECSRGLGLRTMDHRANLLGGELTIDSAPGQGTTITCTAPHQNE